MDEETLSELATLLTGNLPSSVRAATCAAVASCVSGDSGAALRKTMATKDTGRAIIRRLVSLCGDATCTQLALYALINISEDEDGAKEIIKNGGVSVCTAALVDKEQDPFASSFSGLLSNLTRLAEGNDKLVGHNVEETTAAVAELAILKLTNRIDIIPNLLWMANACTSSRGRDILLLRGSTEAQNRTFDEQPLSRLLQAYFVRRSDPSVRLAATSAIRNCALSEECHDVLVNATDALNVCLSCLVSSKTKIDPSHIKDAPKHVRTIVMDLSKAHPEELTSIRLIVLEALLMLCKSNVGLTALREKDAFLILFEWNKQEQSTEISTVASRVMQRITDTGTPNSLNDTELSVSV